MLLGRYMIIVSIAIGFRLIVIRVNGFRPVRIPITFVATSLHMLIA